MKTSIIILTYNNLNYSKLCIDSIRHFTEEGTYEIIVVDNASTDGTVEWLKQQRDIKSIFNKNNLGFPKGCNQGINISDGDNILLLNNDVIVTKNWLKNLILCLHSSKDIGAVGAITNNCGYYQSIPTSYRTIDEMFQFAEKHNISNQTLWEQRLKLIGFCMAFKKEIVDKIGLLDEQFTPGNYEDDDYSFRIIKAGYKLILCKDTFIHHFGTQSFKKESYNELLNVNSIKFQNKWGFNSHYSSYIREEIISQINENNTKEINVLQIGCACGATLLKIKNLYKKANIYGIELNENSAAIAKSFADVKSLNIENCNMPYEENFFDYIIFSDMLEYLYNPEIVLKNIKKLLKDDGKIISSIPNVMHYTVIRSLLNGKLTYENPEILNKTPVKFFTLYEINNMFTKAGYNKLAFSGTLINMTDADKTYIDNLCKISNEDKRQQFSIYQYIIKAYKSV